MREVSPEAYGDGLRPGMSVELARRLCPLSVSFHRTPHVSVSLIVRSNTSWPNSLRCASLLNRATGSWISQGHTGSLAQWSTHVTMIGWLITKKNAETKDGLPREFATFEDQTALYDATIFPEVYRRHCHLLAPDRSYVLRGLIEESFGVVTLTVTDLHVVGINQDTTPPHPLGK